MLPRRLLAGLVSLTLLLACSPAPSTGGAAPAGATTAPASGGTSAGSTSDLQVITSAVYKKSFDDFIVPKMKERYNINVVASPLLSAESLARAIAQKDSPQISVFMLDEGPWLQGKEGALWEKLDTSKVPNLTQIPDRFKDADGQGTALMLVMLGLIYDEGAVRSAGLSAPTSHQNFWDPAYRNRVSIQQFSSTFAFAFLAQTNRIEGGDATKSFDAAFEKIKQLKPNIRAFHGPAAQLIQLFQQKEIWLAWGGHFTAMQATNSGTPIRWAAPKEGAMGYAHYMAIAKGAPNKDGAEKLIDMMLSPEYQKVMAETDFMGPVNPKTQLDAAFASSFPVSQQAIEQSQPIPWSVYNAKRVELNERWQREIESN